MRLSREMLGELVVLAGAILAGCGVFLWLGLPAALGYTGAVLIALGVAMMWPANEGSR